MTRYTFSIKSLLIGFSLLGLLALSVVLFVQAPSPIGVVYYEDESDTISATIVDPLTYVHPADRKFFTHNYAMSGNATPNPYLLADIHPADRKFFTHNYTMSGNATPNPYLLADVHPADRKFFTHNYAMSGNATPNPYLLADVHPADRKFFTNVYGPASINTKAMRAQSEAETADLKLQDPGYLEILMQQARLGLMDSIHPADRKLLLEKN